MDLTIPASVRAELHRELQAAMRFEGPVGDAAHALASELTLPFAKADGHVLPPIGPHSLVAQDPLEPELAPGITLSDSCTLSGEARGD